MTKKTVESTDGPPRWTYIAAAVVAVGGLVWTVASYFITQAAQKPPATAPTLSQNARADGNGTAVNAAGAASVTVNKQP